MDPKKDKTIEIANLVTESHQERLHSIVDISWKIFQSRFIAQRHVIETEAPFQHHFANILSQVGSLYCFDRNDRFFVDLEKREVIKNKTKYFDITCSFDGIDDKQIASCAIELKFKTALQAAQDYGRIDAYKDLEALELACEAQYSFSRFYMITNSQAYVNQSKKGVGTKFCMHHGFKNTPGEFNCAEIKGREDVVVCLKSEHTFEWMKNDEWYFLEVKI